MNSKMFIKKLVKENREWLTIWVGKFQQNTRTRNFSGKRLRDMGGEKNDICSMKRR